MCYSVRAAARSVNLLIPLSFELYSEFQLINKLFIPQIVLVHSSHLPSVFDVGSGRNRLLRSSTQAKV